jgi:hypothetical protein
VLVANKVTDASTIDDATFRRIDGTDVWECSVRMPDDWLGSYAIGIVGDALDEQSAWRLERAAHQRSTRALRRRRLQPRRSGVRARLARVSRTVRQRALAVRIAPVAQSRCRRDGTAERYAAAPPPTRRFWLEVGTLEWATSSRSTR